MSVEAVVRSDSAGSLAQAGVIAGPVPERPQSLARPFLRGLAWTGSARWIAQGVSWAATLVVARLLEPADYGLVAMATVFTGLVSVISEFGIGMTVVTVRRLNAEEVHQLNGLSIIIGTACAGISFALAPVIARVYARPEIVAILQTLAATFALAGWRTVPAAILQREFRFHVLAIIETGQALAGVAVALAAAALGFGYWALVLSSTAATAVWTIAVVAIAPCLETRIRFPGQSAGKSTGAAAPGRPSLRRGTRGQRGSGRMQTLRLPGVCSAPASSARIPWRGRSPGLFRSGSEKTGLITGFLFEPGESGRSIDAEEACDAIGRGAGAFAWLHFNLANQASLRWLRQRLLLPDAFYDTLTIAVARSTGRLEAIDRA